MNEKPIYVIGAGAIGKALSVFLKAAGKKVLLARGSVDVPTKERQTIMVRNRKGTTFQQEIETTTVNELERIDGVVLIATKAFSNPSLAKKLSKKRGDFSIVLMQNGLNVERPFARFKKIYRCVLFSASQFIADNRISFNMVEASPIGKINKEDPDPQDVAQLIDTPYFRFRSEPQIEIWIWEKAILNSVFNSICPLLEIDNGIFYRDKSAASLAGEVIGECVTVAEAYGIKLHKDHLEKKLLSISQSLEGRLISTYVDIKRGRETEIKSLNMEIAKMAAQIRKPELALTTRLLGEMILLKSEIKMNINR